MLQYKYSCPHCKAELTTLHYQRDVKAIVEIKKGFFGKPEFPQPISGNYLQDDVMYLCPNCNEEITVDEVQITEKQEDAHENQL